MHRIERTIAKILSGKSPLVVSLADSVATASKLMRDRNRGCVLIVENDVLVGIFTQQDFLNRIATPGRDTQTTAMSEVMTAAPATLRPFNRVSWAINKMVVGGFRHVPIVNESGLPVGVLSVGDVVEHLSEVFGKLERPRENAVQSEWIDIGGG